MDNKLKSVTIKSKIKQNLDPWLNSFLSEFPTVESQELVQMLIDEASIIWEVHHIQLISAWSWWNEGKFYYSFVTYDDDPCHALRDRAQMRERENFHATTTNSLVNHFLAGSEATSKLITNPDEHMVQITFSIA